MARTFNRLAWVVMVVAAVGCGEPDGRKRVFAVEGRLTHNGKPMGGAMISFHPLNDSSPQAVRAQATADADGRYRLTTYLKDDGAPAGEYAVTVYWPEPKKPSPKKPEAEDEELTPDRLNRRYLNPATTKLRATVGERLNLIDFEVP